MGLSKTHSEPDIKKREPHRRVKALKMQKKIDDYLKADELVDAVYVDFCNAESKSRILTKLQEGAYGNKPYSLQQSYEYVNAALNRIRYDKSEKEDEMRNLLYTRYETLLNDCITLGDRFTARSVLADMAKIFLPQQPQTAIQVNNQGDGKIEVKFGFGNED